MYKLVEEIVCVVEIQMLCDWGNFEDVIKIIKFYGECGCLQIDIGIQLIGDEVGENGLIDVNQYVVIIYENYEYVICKNGLGKKIFCKMVQYLGYCIGFGFLICVVVLEQKSLIKQMIVVIDVIVKEEDK